jgi:predicted O-methyltransferase YrrM
MRVFIRIIAVRPEEVEVSKGNRALDALPDPAVRGVLRRLHAEADREEPRLILQMARFLPALLRRGELPWERLGNRLDDKYIAIDRSQGIFCYLLARALGARQIVEFGTSYGLSTIYLAQAVRDNGGGRVIGTEWVPAKAQRARENLSEAGLLEFVDLRVGDALETLRDLDAPVDFMLNDGFPPSQLPVLRLVAPRLRVGAVVVTDNVGAFWANATAYLDWVRDPANGFASAMLEMKQGTELSVRVAVTA